MCLSVLQWTSNVCFRLWSLMLIKKMIFFRINLQTSHERISSSALQACVWCGHCGNSGCKITLQPWGEFICRFDGMATNGAAAERDVPVCFPSSSSVFVHLPSLIALLIADISLFPSNHPSPHLCPPILAPSHRAPTINIMSRGWQCSFMEHCMFIRGRGSLREMLTVFINGPHPRLMRHGTSYSHRPNWRTGGVLAWDGAGGGGMGRRA